MTQKMDWQNLKAILPILASGIFFGAALADALPEAARELGLGQALAFLVLGFAIWWLQKATLKPWKASAQVVPLATALWFHSVLEGLVTGLSFGISETVGYLVLGGMILHLLPEFFAAVTLLKASGAGNRAAVFVTFAGYAVLFASFAATYRFLPQFGDALPAAVALSGGAFLYIGIVSYWRRFSWATLPWFTVGASLPAIQALWF